MVNGGYTWTIVQCAMPRESGVGREREIHRREERGGVGESKLLSLIMWLAMMELNY